MGKDLESTMRWKVDITQFKSAITEANNKIKLANSEFKKASAGMDDWSKSTDGLRAKITQLNSVADAQRRKVEVLRQAYDDTVKSQGEDSEAAQRLKIQLNNQEAALASTEKEIRKYEQGLDSAGKETEEAGEKTKNASGSFSALQVAIGNLIAEGVKKLISSLGELKQAYQAYDAGADLIITKTGAMGAELEGLTEVYDNLNHSFLGSAENIGSAVGEINTRFGLTGQALQDVSEQFLRFAEINGTDVTSAIESTYRALTSFGLEAKDAGTLLDTINVVGQRTGISVSRLADGLSTNAASFKELGLSIDQSVLLMGQIEASGADVNTVLTGMSRALRNAAKDGLPLEAALAQLEETIIDNADSTEGLAAAYDLFGRSGDKIYNAIRSGALSFRDLASASIDAEGSVANTYEATLDGADQVALALQGMKRDLGKLISEFLDENKEGIKQLLQNVMQFIRSFIRFVQANGTTILRVLAAVGAAITAAFAIGKVKQFTAFLQDSSGLIKKLWGAMQAHPYAAIAVGVGAAAGALIGLVKYAREARDAQYKLTEEQLAFNAAIKEQAEAWGDIKDARTEAISGYEAETQYNQKLYEELQGIVDENGKIKSGYEDRAKVITDTLAKALGVEIEIIDGQIQGYGELRKSIEETIQLKRAEAYLAADEQAYTEAIRNQTKAYGDYKTAAENAATAQGRLADAQRRLEEVQSNTSLTQQDYIRELTNAQNAVALLTEASNQQNAALAQAETTYYGYMATIQNHEGLMASVASGDVGAMTTSLYKLSQGFYTAETATVRMLRNQTANLRSNLARMQADMKSGMAGVTAEQVAAMAQMVSASEAELKKAQNAATATGRAIPRNMADAIRANRYEAINAGADLVVGAQQGIDSQKGSLFSTISNLGKTILSRFRTALQEQSPSKATREMGQFLLQGLSIGMSDEERAVLNQVDSFGNSLVNSLRGNINGSLDGLQVAPQAGNSSTVVFNQYNSSPKALDRLSIYRDTKSILFAQKARLSNA